MTIRRYLPLMAGAALALAAPIATAGSAAAFGGESLACTITPGGGGIYLNDCSTATPASAYGVTYKVQNGTGTYTYAWTVPTAGAGVITGETGCTSSSPTCSIGVKPGASDRILTATVVISQGGSQATLTSTADIPAVCGNVLC